MLKDIMIYLLALEFLCVLFFNVYFSSLILEMCYTKSGGGGLNLLSVAAQRHGALKVFNLYVTAGTRNYGCACKPLSIKILLFVS